MAHRTDTVLLYALLGWLIYCEVSAQAGKFPKTVRYRQVNQIKRILVTRLENDVCTVQK